jgi:hypothetical protein
MLLLDLLPAGLRVKIKTAISLLPAFGTKKALDVFEGVNPF